MFFPEIKVNKTSIRLGLAIAKGTVKHKNGTQKLYFCLTGQWSLVNPYYIKGVDI